MKLFNTLNKQIEVVEAIHPPKIGVYACGPTVYDYAHLGHLRKYMMDDVLVRALKHAGFKVTHVQNITDVGHLTSDEDTGEDKLEKGAKKYQQTVWDIAKKFEDYFFYSMDLIGNLRPDISCRATDHIQEQLALVEKLEKNGFAYVIEGDGVYFDTSKLEDYGKLANLQLDQLAEGSRVAKVAGKRNPSDFALWKFERPGENRAMVWPSPWHPRSFPGWHIECSAMSMKYLGEQFEIHTGGIDHIPVHHTNEIAQSEAATGKQPFVKYWVHHNFLLVEGVKMSKSLGNFFTIDDIIKRGFTPQALRLLYLGAHYRSELNFTWDNLAGVEKSWQKLQAKVANWYKSNPAETTRAVINSAETIQSVAKLSQQAQTFYQQFITAINEDLNTPEVLAVMWQVVKTESVAESEKLTLLLAFDQILGLGLEKLAMPSAQSVETNQPEISAIVQALLQERQTAREQKDWAKADKLRNRLKEQGYQVVDKAGKQEVSKS